MLVKYVAVFEGERKVGTQFLANENCESEPKRIHVFRIGSVFHANSQLKINDWNDERSRLALENDGTERTLKFNGLSKLKLKHFEQFITIVVILVREFSSLSILLLLRLDFNLLVNSLHHAANGKLYTFFPRDMHKWVSLGALVWFHSWLVDWSIQIDDEWHSSKWMTETLPPAGEEESEVTIV